jgi:DNA mismatch repair protein MutS
MRLKMTLHKMLLSQNRYVMCFFMTPMMKQYWEIKSQHTDKILFFRMGDFYELFFEDATIAAPILGITLTSRNKKSEEETPMCGVPHFSIAGHINKLLSLGLKVALCDQVEDPKAAKGIVKRAVTRVLTPGMVFDVDSLDQSRPYYLASFDNSKIALLDLTTGEAFYLSKPDSTTKTLSLIQKFPVVEIVLQINQNEIEIPAGITKSIHTSQSTDACEFLLEYVRLNNSSQDLSFVQSFTEKKLEARLLLSSTTQRHLELFCNSKNELKGSLLSRVDQCRTSAGSRKIREWLQFPLVGLKEIEARLDQVENFRSDQYLLKKLREHLAKLGDLERRLSRISQSSGHARDLQSLAEGVLIAVSALEMSGVDFDKKEILRAWADKVLGSLVDEPPLILKAGGLIKKGVNSVLDELTLISTNAHQILSDMETREKNQTGINSLKIRYNNVFGYYIEVTHTHKDKVPAHYKRKQTLTTAERYYTEELLELEKKILSADVKKSELEYEIFSDLKVESLKLSSPISTLAQKTAELDAYLGLAWLSLEGDFVRPQFNKDQLLDLKSSRHPVVEKTVSRFVANDIELKNQQCLLLTGPNMAGKSTLMRQVALISIMAQMGSFVPASSAHLPIYTQIFTRIGAQDQLSDGLSTFMVEMTETSELLKNADQNSLVILDEIGRGTSTYDGLSLAEAILEYLVNKKISQVFFATHYHEITELSDKYSNLINAHMSVVETSSKIEFLHSLVLKPAGKSYGIQVAKLAGLPDEVIKLAFQNLKKRGNPAVSPQQQLSLDSFAQSELDPTSEALKKIAFEIRDHRLLEKSPLESLQALQKWQSEIQKLDHIK